MDPVSIGPSLPVPPTIGAGSSRGQEPRPAPPIDFGRILQQAYDEVVESQQRADRTINEFVTGGDVDVHEVMISAQQANLTLSMAILVRNRVVETVQELLRIQI